MQYILFVIIIIIIITNIDRNVPLILFWLVIHMLPSMIALSGERIRAPSRAGFSLTINHFVRPLGPVQITRARAVSARRLPFVSRKCSSLAFS